MDDLFSYSYQADADEKIGIEIEFQLLDEKTLDLADRIEPLLERIGKDSRISAEVFQSCIEINTTPATNTKEAEKQIVEILNKIKPHLPPLGLKLGSLGVHLFTKRLSQTTNKERYLNLEKEHPYITHSLLDFSTQVHVSMASFEETLKVMNSMRILLPVFIAVSASCPYWKAKETGFVSFRQYLLKTNFNGGPPPHINDKKEFKTYYDAALKSGAIKSLKDIHWDIKPRPDLGTLELRIMDAVPTLEEAMALVTLAHCTMRILKTRSLKELLPQYFEENPLPWAESINYFQASHEGIEAQYIASPSGETFPLRNIALDLIEAIEETALELDEQDGLLKIKQMLEEGLPYQRMMKVFEDTRSLKEVVRSVADNF